MSKKIVSALSALALSALAACGDETVEEGDTTIVEGQAADPVYDDFPEANVPVDDINEDGDSFSISEDGVNARINDGNTSVNAEIDGDPSMSVETD